MSQIKLHISERATAKTIHQKVMKFGECRKEMMGIFSRANKGLFQRCSSTHSQLCETSAQEPLSDDSIISRHFPTVWPARSPDLNPCNFWLWGYLKDLVYSDPIRSLSDLKDSIARHVRNIPKHTLQSTTEHAMLRFQMVADNDGHHIEHVLSSLDG